MNSRLNIDVVMEDHELHIIDNSQPNWNGCHHLLIRLLEKGRVKSDDEILDVETVEVTKDSYKPENKKYTVDKDYFISEDGKYMFYECMIPDYNHCCNGGENPDQAIWYEKKEGKYIVHYEDNKWDPIKNFGDIYAVASSGIVSFNCFWFDAITFTTSDLISCFLKMEEEKINNYTDKCKGKCDKKNLDLDERLTLVSAAITTIDYYLSSDEWDKAQNILEKITSCSNLCNSINTKTSCNCGRTS